MFCELLGQLLSVQGEGGEEGADEGWVRDSGWGRSTGLPPAGLCLQLRSWVLGGHWRGRGHTFLCFPLDPVYYPGSGNSCFLYMLALQLSTSAFWKWLREMTLAFYFSRSRRHLVEADISGESLVDSMSSDMVCWGWLLTSVISPQTLHPSLITRKAEKSQQWNIYKMPGQQPSKLPRSPKTKKVWDTVSQENPKYHVSWWAPGTEKGQWVKSSAVWMNWTSADNVSVAH